MIRHWTKFEGAPYGAQKDRPRVTLNPKKTFLLNAAACQAMDYPPAVELLFDQTNKIIGIKPTDPTCRNAFRLKEKKGCRYRIITASAFCTHFGIKVDRTVLFENIDLDNEGVMTLDINQAINVGRGAR